jgi:hypothetical protein
VHHNIVRSRCKKLSFNTSIVDRVLYASNCFAQVKPTLVAAIYVVIQTNIEVDLNVTQGLVKPHSLRRRNQSQVGEFLSFFDLLVSQ